jgi:hypothetical protein
MERQRRRMSDERVSVADARDRLADERDRLADERDREADVLEEDLLGALDQVGQRLVQGLAENRVDRTRHRTRQAEHADLTERVGGTDIAGDTGDAWHAERRDFLADDREERADLRETLGDAREQSADERERLLSAVAGAGQAAGSGAAGGRQSASAARSRAADARAAAARSRAALPVARPLTEAFMAISEALSGPPGLDHAFEQAVVQARRLVPGATSVSLCTLDGAVARTAAATDRIAAELDQVQYTSGQGPCLQAITTYETVSSADLGAESAWPAFTAAAATAAVRSVLSTPTPRGPSGSGAAASINHYSDTVAAFDEEDIQIATLLAAHLAAVLVVAAAANSEIQHLGQAIAARDVIGQAKGILMERHRLDAAQAFEVLRIASTRLNRKLRDLADEVAFTGVLPGTPLDPPG